jgi:hypothetical protein
VPNEPGFKKLSSERSLKLLKKILMLLCSESSLRKVAIARKWKPDFSLKARRRSIVLRCIYYDFRPWMIRRSDAPEAIPPRPELLRGANEQP